MVDKILREFNQKLIRQKKAGLVLDIDDTLADTNGYWVRQCQLLFGNPEKLSVSEFVKKYEYAQNAPYWQTLEALSWMEKTRNDPQSQECLAPVVGARRYVKKINSLVPIVGYLTTRPRKVLGVTRAWLAKFGFPSGDILARPDSVNRQKGDQWKARALEYLYPQVLGIVDDKRAVVEFLPASYPGVVFLFGHAFAPVSRPRVYPAASWPEVFAQVKSIFKSG